MIEITVKIKFVDLAAKKFGLPKYRHNGDAGVDLHVILPEEERKHGKTIFPGERALLDTGLHMQLPVGFWARITHRSSTEKKYRLRVVEGTIDQGYIGRLYTQVSNDQTYPVEINHGDRIAQLIILPIVHGIFEEVDELESTDRGDSGFGSTGS